MVTASSKTSDDAQITSELDEPPRLQFRSDFSVVEAIGYAFLWFILGIVTLGLAFFVFPYYAEKHVLNKIYAVNRHGEIVGQMSCNINLGQAIGHAIIWMLLSIITLGIAGVVYVFIVTAYTMRNTHIAPT